MRGRSRASLLAFAALAVLVAVASFAWACTVGEVEYAAGEQHWGAPGSEVTIQGGNWGTHKDIEVRWDGAGSESPLLAQGNTGEYGAFTVTFAIPSDAAEGSHKIYVVISSMAGENNGLSYWVGTQAPPPPERRVIEGDEDRERDPGRDRRRDEQRRETPAQSEVAEVAPAGPPAQVTTTSGRTVFGGSVASKDLAGPRRGEDRNPLIAKLAAEPVLTPAAGEGRPAPRHPSLLPNLVEAEPVATGPNSYLLAGALLFGFGVVALLAGFVIADARRSRARGMVEPDGDARGPIA